MRTRTRKRALAIAFTLLATVSGLSSTISPAAAQWDYLCYLGEVCWYPERDAQGDHMWQFAQSHRNIQSHGVAPQSGQNRGTTGMRACGYSYPDYVNLNFSAAQGERKNFSLRIESSVRWVWGTCSAA